MFFTFDGIDGAGKSTQLDLFVSWLSERGNQVVTCRDPGTTDLGEAVRDILLGAEYRIDNRAEMLLYMACRAQLVDEFIRPMLAEDKVVISDRYLLANVVYQGCAGGLEPSDIWRVGDIATKQLMPDLTFVLDLAPEIAAKRLGDQRDRMEARGLDYFAKVRQGFIEQSQRHAERTVLLDATQSVEEIQQQIRAATEEKMKPRHA